jgi:hypothetical protein
MSSGSDNKVNGESDAHQKAPFGALFAHAVLEGVRARGFTSADLKTRCGVSPALQARIATKSGKLTDRQVSRIEAMTGYTGGQLATRALPKSDPIRKLMDGWARVADLKPLRRPKRVKVSPARPAASPKRRRVVGQLSK